MEHFSVYITRLNAVCDPKGRRVGYPEKKEGGQKGRTSFRTIASHCAFLQGNALLSCCILLGQVITQSQTSLNVVIYRYLSG